MGSEMCIRDRLNVEAILNLRPTLVLVDRSVGPVEAIDQLRAAGITTVMLEPTRSLASIAEDITNVATLVGEPEAGRLLAERSEKEVQQALDAIAAVAPEEPLRMSFLYARGTGGVFYLLGREEGTEELITALGGRDVNSEPVSYTHLTLPTTSRRCRSRWSPYH